MPESNPTHQGINGISIIVPVYNEATIIESTYQNLQRTLATVELPFEIIMVNDGSTDGSGDVLRKFCEKNFFLVEHAVNRGYGAALKSGVRKARFGWILIIDADGTYPYDAIPELLKRTALHDMVIAARTGKKVQIPLLRRPAKWLLNQLANYLSGTRIPDLNSGLRAIRKEVLENYFHLLPDGFSFTMTITLALTIDGYQVNYFPINYEKRTGKSKIRPFRDTLNFLQTIIRTTLYFNPLQVFVPLSFGFLGLSLLFLLSRIVQRGGFGVTIVLLFLSGMQLLVLGMIADLIVRRTKWKSFR